MDTDAQKENTVKTKAEIKKELTKVYFCCLQSRIPRNTEIDTRSGDRDILPGNGGELRIDYLVWWDLRRIIIQVILRQFMAQMILCGHLQKRSPVQGRAH